MDRNFRAMVEVKEIHRNVKSCGGSAGLPDYVKVRQLTLALNEKWTRFDNLKRDSMLGLWKLMTGWEDSCELPVRSMLISAVILIGVLRILHCERLPEIVAQLDRHTADCKELSWNHVIGQYEMVNTKMSVTAKPDDATDTEEDKIVNGLMHRSSSLVRELPFNMSMPFKDALASLAEDGTYHKPKFLIQTNWNTSAAKFKCAVGSCTPLSSVFADVFSEINEALPP